MTDGARTSRRTQGLGSDKSISLKVTTQQDRFCQEQADKANPPISKSEFIRSLIDNASGGAD